MLEEWIILDIQRKERERKEQESAMLPLYAPAPELCDIPDEEDDDDSNGHVIEIDI